MILNGTLTYSKSIYKEIEEAIGKPEWQRMKGQEISRAIEARGFTNDPLHRTYRKSLKLQMKDFIVMLIAFAAMTAVVYFSSKKGGLELCLPGNFCSGKYC